MPSARRGFGVARHARTVLYVAVSRQGIGGGLVIGGEAHRGARFTGEISHVNVVPDSRLCPCGRRGCLAAGVRADAARLVAARASVPPREREVRELIGRDVGAVGRAVAGVVNVVHPDVVVVADAQEDGLVPDLVARIGAEVGRHAHPEIAACPRQG